MSQLLKEVVQVVKKIGKQIATQSFSVSQKDGCANIVTTADLFCQEQLQEQLRVILPNSGFLGEENETFCQDQLFWVVDPIDGTANFSRGIDEYAISVALCTPNETLLGMVYNPTKDIVYYAEKGSGAFCNDKPINVSNRPFSNGIFCTAASLYNKSLAHVCFQIIEDVYMRCNDLRRFGACALEICRLAEGTCDLYFEIRVFSWDCTAALLILQEAGGYACSALSYKFTKDESPFPVLCANTQENLEEIKRTVEKYLTKEMY